MNVRKEVVKLDDEDIRNKNSVLLLLEIMLYGLFVSGIIFWNTVYKFYPSLELLNKIDNLIFFHSCYHYRINRIILLFYSSENEKRNLNQIKIISTVNAYNSILVKICNILRINTVFDAYISRQTTCKSFWFHWSKGL